MSALAKEAERNSYRLSWGTENLDNVALSSSPIHSGWVNQYYVSRSRGKKRCESPSFVQRLQWTGSLPRRWPLFQLVTNFAFFSTMVPVAPVRQQNEVEFGRENWCFSITYWNRLTSSQIVCAVLKAIQKEARPAAWLKVSVCWDGMAGLEINPFPHIVTHLKQWVRPQAHADGSIHSIRDRNK